MWQIYGAAQKQITHKVIASSGCGIWKETGSITPQSRPSVTFATIYWGTSYFIFPTTFAMHGFVLLLLILKKKKLNIFSFPYVDIAVKAHSFFLLAEWEQCSKHINHRQGISSSYARLCHSVCVENVSHLSCFGILWQFFFFFFPSLTEASWNC